MKQSIIPKLQSKSTSKRPRRRLEAIAVLNVTRRRLRFKDVTGSGVFRFNREIVQRSVFKRLGDFNNAVKMLRHDSVVEKNLFLSLLEVHKQLLPFGYKMIQTNLKDPIYSKVSDISKWELDYA